MSRKDYKHLYQAYDPKSEAVKELDQALKVIGTAAYAKGHYESDIKGPGEFLIHTLMTSWTKLISEPFFSGARSQPAEAIKLHRKLTPKSTDAIIDAFEVISNTDARGPSISAMYGFLEEAASVALQIHEAMERAIKGSRPGLLESGYGTCPCCFNVQGVKADHMVNHGYMKPDRWNRTAGCEGAGEPPLELSTIGLEKMLERHRGWIKARQGEVDHPETVESVWTKDKGSITPDMPNFEKLRDNYVKSLPHEIGQAKTDLILGEEKLGEWAAKLEVSAPKP
jgi:hypothetical protein